MSETTHNTSVLFRIVAMIDSLTIIIGITPDLMVQVLLYRQYINRFSMVPILTMIKNS